MLELLMLVLTRRPRGKGTAAGWVDGRRLRAERQSGVRDCQMEVRL